MRTSLSYANVVSTPFQPLALTKNLIDKNSPKRDDIGQNGWVGLRLEGTERHEVRMAHIAIRLALMIIVWQKNALR